MGYLSFHYYWYYQAKYPKNNGMGCLAASLIANFKQSPGGFYIHPVSQKNCGQDYEYHIYNIDGEFKIEVYYCPQFEN